MSRLRQTIAQRLKDAQNTAAILTTFNDVDMSAVIDARARYKDLFEKKHGIRLGFMGFFVKACVQALREIPAVNAEIDGRRHRLQELLRHRRRGRRRQGPGRAGRARRRPHVLRRDREGDRRLRQAASEGKLTLEDMQGGTFTISNGGVFGSLLSTPILNPPQSGILGMHRIEERAGGARRPDRHPADDVPGA